MREHEKTLCDALMNLDDSQLQYDYLNRFDQTEAIAQMLPHLAPELALRVVRLALEVDLGLGSHLAGYVPPEAQPQAVQMILDLGLSKELTVDLLKEMRSPAALPFLVVPILHNEDWAIRKHRSNVMSAILQIEHPDAIQALQSIFNQELESVFFDWQDLCLYPNNTTTHLILELIHNPPKWLCETDYYGLTSELAKRGHHTVIPVLMDALANCSDRWMLNNIMDGLAELGVMAAVEAIATLSASDEYPEPENPYLYQVCPRWLCSHALEALAKLGGPIAEELIRHSLCDVSLKEPPHRTACHYRSLWGTRQGVIEVAQCLQGDDGSVRKQALRVLGCLAREDTPDGTMSKGEIKDGIIALEILVQSLNDVDLSVRTLAAQILADLISESRIYSGEPWDIALRYPNFNPRESWSCLEKLEHEKILNVLVEGLTGDDVEYEKSLITSLVRLGHPAAQTALLKMIEQHKMPEVKGYAAKALASFKNPDSLPILLSFLSQDIDEEIRADLAIGLSFYTQLKPIPSGLTDLFLALANGYPVESRETSREIRRIAIATLDKIGGTEAMLALEKALLPEEPERVFLAPTVIESLSKIATPQAISILVRCFQESLDDTFPLYQFGGYDLEDMMDALARTGAKNAFDTILDPLPYGHSGDSDATEVMKRHGRLEHVTRLWEIRKCAHTGGFWRAIASIQHRSGYYNPAFCDR